MLLTFSASGASRKLTANEIKALNAKTGIRSYVYAVPKSQADLDKDGKVTRAELMTVLQMRAKIRRLRMVNQVKK